MRPPLSLHHKKRRLHSLKAQYTSEATSANDGLKWHFDDNRNREKGRRQRRYFKIKSNDRWGTILICVDLTTLSHCSNSWSVMVCWIFQSYRTTKNGKVKPMMLICAGDVMWFCLKLAFLSLHWSKGLCNWYGFVCWVFENLGESV